MNNIIVAARNDGFGERMCSMLNAMYIAKKTGWDFKFVWQNLPTPKLENDNKNILLPWNDMLPQELMFSQDFIKKNAAKNISWHNDTLIKTNHYKTLQETIKNPGKYDWGNGHYSLQEYLADYFTDIDPKEYADTIQECWNEIEFTPNIQHALTFAKHNKDLPNNFVAIHIRCGDALINGDIYQARHKAVNIYLVLGIIEQEIQQGNKIVLFSDDLVVLQEIKQQTNAKFHNQVFAIDDFFEREKHTQLEQSIFEIITMSQAAKIYSGISGFSRLANMIGNNKHIIIYNFLSQEKQYNTTHKLIKQYKLPPIHEAFGYMHLFDLARLLKKSTETQKSHIQKAYTLNPNEPALQILFIYALLINKDFQEAEKKRGGGLKLIYKNSKEAYLNELLRENWGSTTLLYTFTFGAYFSVKPIESFPYIAYFSYIVASKFLTTSHLDALYQYDAKLYFTTLKMLPTNFNQFSITAKQIEQNLPTLPNIPTKASQRKLFVQYQIKKRIAKLKNSIYKRYETIFKLIRNRA